MNLAENNPRILFICYNDWALLKYIVDRVGISFSMNTKSFCLPARSQKPVGDFLPKGVKGWKWCPKSPEYLIFSQAHTTITQWLKSCKRVEKEARGVAVLR